MDASAAEVCAVISTVHHGAVAGGNRATSGAITIESGNSTAR